MFKKAILALVLCTIVLSALGARPVAAAPLTASSSSVLPVAAAAACKGWHGWGTNGSGWWVSLDTCDISRIYSGAGTAAARAFGLPWPLNGIALAILGQAAARIHATDKGRGVRIFQYWWVVPQFPMNTWMWAIEAQ